MTSKMRAFALATWFLIWLFAFWALWTPIPFLELRVALLTALIVIPVGAFWLFPRGRIPITIICLVCTIGVSSIKFWPAKAYSKPELQSAYISSLRSYLDTKYVWGGENRRGIDCSGLVRRAMMDALINRGWHEKNPYLWRSAAQIWWYDCAARDIKDGADWRFQAEFEAPDLNELNNSRLSLGDLAVTRSGVHVLAFVGNRTWIQADPNLANGGDKVILTTAPSKNGWFGQKMVICRWKFLNP